GGGGGVDRGARLRDEVPAARDRVWQALRAQRGCARGPRPAGPGVRNEVKWPSLILREGGVGVPYRIDISCPPDDVVDRLVQSGAADIERVGGGVGAIISCWGAPGSAAGARGGGRGSVSPPLARGDAPV